MNRKSKRAGPGREEEPSAESSSQECPPCRVWNYPQVPPKVAWESAG